MTDQRHENDNQRPRVLREDADLPQNFKYRFVLLPHADPNWDLTIDILESGESYFLLDPRSLDQLIDTLQEARQILHTGEGANNPELLAYYEMEYHPEYRPVGTQTAYRMRWSGARRD